MIAEVIEIIKNSPWNSYETGMEASFKRINDKWGLKFYKSEWMRDHTYHLQSLAYDIGCAPELGEKFEINIGEEKVYGYITECANMLTEKCSDGYYPDDFDIDYFSEVDLRDMRNTINRCREIMEVNDMHGGNLGRLNDGRLVIIDFSHCEEKNNYTDSIFIVHKKQWVSL